MEQFRTVRKVALPNGGTIAVQALGTLGAQDVSSGGSFDFEQVSSALTGLAEVAKQAIERATPDSATVEFGMNLTVEAGKLTALLMSGSGSASLKVTLNWKSARPDPPPPVQLDPGSVQAASAPGR